jgi:hypothetical protein
MKAGRGIRVRDAEHQGASLARVFFAAIIVWIAAALSSGGVAGRSPLEGVAEDARIWRLQPGEGFPLRNSASLSVEQVQSGESSLLNLEEWG